MLNALARLIRPQSDQAPDLSPLWISVTSRAFRANGAQIATSRLIIKFDAAGALRFHKKVDWRPFTPNLFDHRETDFALYDGVKLRHSLRVDGAQWRKIEQYDLERFLMEAAASRDFRDAFSRVATR